MIDFRQMQTLLKDFSHYKVTGDNSSKIFIFGAGTIGRLTDLVLKKRGENAVCFIDSDPIKQGGKFKTNQ
tara:strand:- start:98 stop:307 length:210 start_codon:yes stop_codon:yes gene_type:complete